MSDLAATIRQLSTEANPTTNPGARRIQISLGTVGGTNPLNVNVGSDVTLYAYRLSSYTPSVGQTVVVLVIGEHAFVLGEVAV